jgi:hypothetical protein
MGRSIGMMRGLFCWDAARGVYRQWSFWEQGMMKKPAKPVEKMRSDANWTSRMIQNLKTFWPESTEAQRVLNSPYFDERQYFAEIETFVSESEGQVNSMNEIDQVTFKGTLTKFMAVAEAILTEWDALINNFEIWMAARAEGKSERIQKLKTGVRLAEDVSGPEVVSQAKLLYYRPVDHAQRYGNYGKVVATHLPEDQTRLRVYADPDYRDELTKQWNRLREDLSAQGWIVSPRVPAQLDAASPAELSAAAGAQLDVWEKIADYKWDRSAVRMLYEGYTSPEIASKIGDLSAKTVDNRLSVLRSQYGFIETREEIERQKRPR